MAFKKLSAPTLKELFIQELETMMLSGELPIGSRLPPERELAKTMQISRAVVNAGIVEMADKGFLEINPRKGTYVADFHVNGKLDILVSIMKYNGGRLPNEDIRSILELRRVLLTFALELAIPRLSGEQLAELRKQCEELKTAKNSEEAAEIIFEFDHMLSSFSGNTLLPLIFSSFRSPIMTLWERYFKRHGIDIMYKRTEKLLQHMEEKDVEAAEGVISESIVETIRGKTEIYTE